MCARPREGSAHQPSAIAIGRMRSRDVNDVFGGLLSLPLAFVL